MKKFVSMLVFVCVICAFFAPTVSAVKWYKTYPVEYPLDCNGRTGVISFHYNSDYFYLNNHELTPIDPNWPGLSAYATTPFDTADYNDSSVTTDKIADSNITSAKIAANAVNTADVNTGAITPAKLSEAAYTGTYLYAIDVNGNDSYKVTLSPAPTAYAAGMIVIFDANTANTGACSLAVNGLVGKSLKVMHDRDPNDNYIEAGSIIMTVYDGTNFQIQTPAANNETGQ